jgi:hypothetical protein
MLKTYVEVTCNECGKVVTGEFIPENWVRSVVGLDCHFCSAACQQKALDRIDAAYTKVFGRYLTDAEVTKLRKSAADRNKEQTFADSTDTQ